VGDGDFSFSKAIDAAMSHIHQESSGDGIVEFYEKKALGGGNIYTSHESGKVVREIYPGCAERLDTLLGQVIHEVDATDLKSVSVLRGEESSFDVIAWNFPCVRVLAGKDGQVDELEANKTLMRRFFRSCASFLKPGGEVESCLVFTFFLGPLFYRPHRPHVCI
jgi:hypothetical protein